MTVERKLDGTVENLQRNNRFVSQTQLYISCEKSRGLHLAKPGLMVGSQAGRQSDKILVRFEFLKACCT